MRWKKKKAKQGRAQGGKTSLINIVLVYSSTAGSVNSINLVVMLMRNKDYAMKK